MNKQEVFDRVWNHFVVEGNPLSISRDIEGSCLYRGPDGTKCAVGLLIPDELYSPDMEGNSVCGLIDDFANKSLAKVLDVENKDDISFLARLQSAHDLADDVDPIEDRLRDVAERCKLSIPRGVPSGS